MFKLIALAMHFSPYQQGTYDPMVVEMLRREYLRTTTPSNVVEFPEKPEELQKAA